MLKGMYDDGKIAAKDYHTYTKQMLEVQKDIMDKVVSVVVDRIEDEVSALEKQKEAIENNYQVKIDAIQSEIDALEEAYKKRQDQIDLEKTQYELERAMNQRTKKVYIGDGFIYDTDDKAIRDSQNELADKQHNLKISELKSQIESLERAMESETLAIDSQIEKLNEYKDQWNSVTDEYEYAQAKMYADGLLGLDWQNEVLNGNLDLLNAFATQYFAIQQALADAAWNSANEQIKAAQEAQKGASGTIGSASTIDYSQSGNAFTKKTSTNETTASLRDRQDKIYHNKMDKLLLGYYTGTDNAKKGIREVSEKGDEIIIDNDNNAILAKGHQLYNFEGGERVIKADETTKLLKNQGNLVRVETLFSNIDTSKFMQNIPNITPDIKFPKFDYSHLNRSNANTQPNVNIGDIHLHEVQNVDSFAKELNKHLPSISVQFRGKH